MNDRAEQGPVPTGIRAALARVRAVLDVVSALGWTLIVLAGCCWLGAALFGWVEFGFATVVFVLILAACALFCIGRLHLDVRLDVDPLRVTVGESAAAQLVVTNKAARPTLTIGAELTVGQTLARYTIPPLGPGAEHGELSLIPTNRRGVVEIGPVVTQRGDPFRVFRREVTWARRHELFVHPRTVALESFGSGLLRDLEGRSTSDISMSDLAFHTLRGYEAGDDRRHIHWRSSAKLSAAGGQDAFLVRQYLDTRRSYVGLIVDVAPDSYETEDDFELAVSAGASIVSRALADQMDLAIVCGRHAVVQPVAPGALDTFSLTQFEQTPLPAAANRLGQLAPGVSTVVLCTGSRAGFSQFLAARAYLGAEVGALAVCVHTGAPVGLRELDGVTVLTIGALADLPPVLMAVVTA